LDVQTQLFLLAHVVGASLLGSLVGMERDLANKPAGSRTHTLTAGAAAFLVLLGDAVLEFFDPQALISADPIRIIHAIVVGVSFLGAGTIFKDKDGDGDPIEGLTTGASLLSVAAMGIAIALQLYWLAVGVAVANVVINWGMDNLANALKDRLGIDREDDK
jgi:putative Mg2+ transporter-C (MgtC) family protein